MEKQERTALLQSLYRNGKITDKSYFIRFRSPDSGKRGGIMREIMEDSSINEEIYRNAEEKANRFNLVCLGLLSVLVLLSEVLNELGIFTAPIPVMRGSTVLGILFFNLAALAVLACRLTKKNEDLLRRPGFKYLIILSGYLLYNQVISVKFDRDVVLFQSIEHPNNGISLTMVSARKREIIATFLFILI